MAELIDSVLSLYQGRLAAMDIHVERKFDPQMDLFCYAGEIRQVLANLVGNSIDATIDGGRLLVRARRSRDWKDAGEPGVRFAVADTGSGMEPGVRDRIFEAFFTTKEVTGTGLGLYLTRYFIEAHYGRVEVVSAKGEGSTFKIFLPIELPKEVSPTGADVEMRPGLTKRLKLTWKSQAVADAVPVAKGEE